LKKILIISFFTISLILTNTTATKLFNISQSELNAINAKYGEKAKRRVEIWDNIIQNAKNKDILNKLKDVNDFWNKIRYSRDSKHWGKNDYWAAPFEFLGTGAGDCEDYAIAK